MKNARLQRTFGKTLSPTPGLSSILAASVAVATFSLDIPSFAVIEFWLPFCLLLIIAVLSVIIGLCLNKLNKIYLHEPMYRALYENAPDAILLCDKQGRILQANAQAEMTFSRQRHELIGQPIESLGIEGVYDPQRKTLHEVLFALAPNRWSPYPTIARRHRSGDRRDDSLGVNLSSYSLDDEPRVIVFVQGRFFGLNENIKNRAANAKSQLTYH
jgi:PAS domain S-box-containing protein